MIDVVVAEDQALVREGLCSLLALTPDIRVVAQCQDGDSVVYTINQYRPDVLLLDLRMPALSGIEVLKQLVNCKHAPATIVLTTFNEQPLIRECVQLGAKGYLRKDVCFKTLTASIYAVASGETRFQPGLCEEIEQKVDKQTANSYNLLNCESLNKTESAVLRLVAAGFSDSEIAQTLCKSSGTIRNNVSSILTKLQARDRTQAVIKALERSLLSSN